MINFVSNLPQDLRSGGFSAMNAAAFAALSGQEEDVHYVGPIDPQPSLFAKVVSKAGRMTGLGGDFFTFSPNRLAAIAAAVSDKARPDARVDFFHGFTPWVSTAPPRPYLAWSDCTFKDYVDIYHRRQDFRPADLVRIEGAEAAWLTRANRVAFTSRWAAERAQADYGLDPDRVAVVGIFGEIDVPAHDAFAGGNGFVFVSTNFEAKGGRVALDALRLVQERHPDAQLTVVGDCPSDLAAAPGVTAVGFLRKESPAENQRFRDILGLARGLVHPTRSDIAPLLVVEAAYFGCPAISSRRFAIPELVDDGRSGILVEQAEDPAAVAAAMVRLIEDEEGYRRMRSAAWTTSRERHSRSAFDARLVACVTDAVR